MRLYDFINSTAGINQTSQLFINHDKNVQPITQLTITNDALICETVVNQPPLTLHQFIQKTQALPINYRITFQNKLTTTSINVWGYRIIHEKHQLVLH